MQDNIIFLIAQNPNMLSNREERFKIKNKKESRALYI
jgi:hypothetical protein